MFINKMLKEYNRFRLCFFCDKAVKENFPNATRAYYSNMSDMILAVEQGKRMITNGCEGIDEHNKYAKRSEK